MDYNKYLSLILSEKLKEATKYKSEFIPSVLYKYYSLNNNEEYNNKKLNTLAAGQVYLSSLDEFNDPFEGQSFWIDENKLIERGWNPKIFRNFISEINSNVGICCFSNSEEKEQNMPMWAYYANNHSGFCVEYKLDSNVKKFMYPVSYDKKRISGNILLVSIFKETNDFIKQDKTYNEIPGELLMLNHMAYLSLTSKSKSWSHEKEIRALVPRSYGDYLNIIPSKIFIGFNCKDSHKEKLIKISKIFNCEIYQMKNEPNSSNHWLVKENLLVNS